MIFDIIAILTIFLIWGFRTHLSQKYMRQAISNIPGPYAIPLLGSVTVLATLSPSNIFKKSAEKLELYGSIVKLWAFQKLLIFSADVELNEQILTSATQISKADLYKVLLPWLGDGLLTSSGKRWHSHRKIITPAFHFKTLETFMEIFDRQASILLNCLAVVADGKSAFNVLPFIAPAVLDVYAETSMGVQVNAQTKQNVPYILAFAEVSRLFTWRFTRVYTHNELVFSILHPFKKMRQTKLIEGLHEFTRKAIEKRRKILQSNFETKGTTNTDETVETMPKKHQVFMDIMLQSTLDDKPLSDDDICAEVDTLMLGGTDTTARTISFVLHLLARHPQVQNQVLAEIRQVFGEKISISTFTTTNLNDLKYMTCVIKETMRVYPTVPLIGRELTEDFKYTHSRLGDGVLPAGSQIIISAVDICSDPKLFHNPTEFRPERHEDSKLSGACIFTPFSAGPRNCVGQKFAMLEMKVIVTKIINEYELLPLGPNVEPTMGLTLGSKTGIQLGLRKRSYPY